MVFSSQSAQKHFKTIREFGIPMIVYEQAPQNTHMTPTL